MGSSPKLSLKLSLRLSQGALAQLTACPRRFQYIVLEQEAGVTSPELQQRLDWGKQFHQSVEQWEMGLSVEELLTEPLQKWWQAFLQIQGELVRLGTGEAVVDRAVELEQCCFVGEHLLVGVYDLLLLGDHSAEIVDWKTYGKPREGQEDLGQDWQTRLYLYLLARNLADNPLTAAIAPEDISMTYWFLGGPQPESWRRTYDGAQHAATEAELQTWLARLTQWLAAYEHHQQAFPQVDDRAHCQQCPFNLRCDRLAAPEQSEDIDRLDLIPEVSLG
jgi:hypothetical protein